MVVQKGLQRIRAEERVDGDAVSAEDIEECSRVRGRGVRHVPALGVEDEDAVARNVGTETLEDRVAGRPELLEEGQVRLERADVVDRRLDDVETLALGFISRRDTIRIETRAQE